MRKRHPAWARNLKVGDVLQRPGGSSRIVRSVSFYPNGDLRAVWFTIKHCSWTGRCYTVIGYTDLFAAGYRPVGVRSKLRSRIDKIIARDMLYANRFDQKLSCCDVRGIA